MTNCVYIHIPFCEKKCNYCAFCSFETLCAKEKYLKALQDEIKFHYKNETLKTLYFGGGTPSLLDICDFEKLLALFKFDKETEITIEINPHSVNFEKLKNLYSLGFNRISLGVQCFENDILKQIGRLHNENDIYRTIDEIKKANFDNFSIDLMYGLPNQDIKTWQNTLDKALGLEANHISLYGLKIEKGTYFYKYPPKNIANADIQAQMYEIALAKLSDFSHYEFSNFALGEKYYSKHNLAYWKRENYYGFGLSASGFSENKRYTNTKNLSNYLKDPCYKKYEQLSIQEEIEEEIFLGLRLIEGINFYEINKKYNIDIFEYYKKEFNKFLDIRLMEKTNVGIKLTKKGQMLQNEILCDFIKV